MVYFHENKSFHLLDTPTHHPLLNSIIYNGDHYSVPLISITQLHPSCTASSKCLKKIVPVSVRNPPPRTSQPRNGRNNAAWPRLRATSRIRRDTGNEVSAVIFLEQAAQQGPKRIRAKRERETGTGTKREGDDV